MGEEDKKLKDLDNRISKISKSTRGSFGIVIPIHDNFRQKYGWYYRWHLKKYATVFHILLLIIYLTIIGFLAYVIFSDPILPTQAINTYTS